MAEIDANLQKAFAKLACGKLAESEQLFTNLLPEKPIRAEALIGLAVIKTYTADYDEALVFLREAAELLPDNARINSLLAFALAKLNLIDEAQQFAARAVELNCDDEFLPRAQTALCMAAGDAERALSFLRTYIDEHEDALWDTWNDLGQIYYALEQYELASEAFLAAEKSAAMLGVSIPYVHYNLGLCENARGDLDGAKLHFALALKLDPELAPAWAALGTLVCADGDFDRAIDLAYRAVELVPDNPSFWMALAQIYDSKGDSSTAEEMRKQAFSIELPPAD